MRSSAPEEEPAGEDSSIEPILLNRIKAEITLVRITVDLLYRICITGAIGIFIDILFYVLRVRIFINDLLWLFVKREDQESDCQTYTQWNKTKVPQHLIGG